jgi:hypothetical protein
MGVLGPCRGAREVEGVAPRSKTSETSISAGLALRQTERAATGFYSPA